MRGDPAIELDELLVYYRGAHFATVALKGRLAKLHGGRECVREIGRYQAMTKRYRDALNETAAMRGR